MVRRRSLRLAQYDYASAGAYFITICTHNRSMLFDRPHYREIATTQWERSAAIRHGLSLDAFVVMPNHVHGVVWLDATEPPEAQHAAQLQRNSGAPSGSLGAFVRGHKSAVTREINLTRNTPGQRVWQPNYYEHIIRDENGLVRIREYIEDNPRRWHLDRENPNGLPDDQEIAFWRDLNPAVVAQRAAPADQQ